MTTYFGPNSNKAKVYKALLTHEYMSTKKLQQKLPDIPAATISSTLSLLRNDGLAEYRGVLQQEGGLQWRKHPLDRPLSPPQVGVSPRKGSGPPVVETWEQVVERIERDLGKLKSYLRVQENKTKKYHKLKDYIDSL